jgi:putative transposase
MRTEGGVPYWKFYYHLVWATKNREPLITEDRFELVRRALAAIAVEHDVFVHAIGIMPDHVHLAVSIPPRHAVSDIVKKMKGLSSRRISATFARPGDAFAWQPEYGALTFGERSLADVVSYVTNQREIHAKRQTLAPYEQIERPFTPKLQPGLPSSR